MTNCLRHGRGHIGLLVFLILAVMAHSVRAETSPSELQDIQQHDASAEHRQIEFYTQIKPIFDEHCVACHASEKSSSALSLESVEGAKAGGASGKPILGGTLESNELFRRVTSTERTYRMPKNADPLSDDEIDRIKRWVEQGTPWPELIKPQIEQDSYFRNLISAFDAFTERHNLEIAYAKPFFIFFLLGQLLLLIVARARTAYRNGQPWAMGRARWMCRLASATSAGELNLAWLLLVLLMVLVVGRGYQLKVFADMARLEQEVTRLKSNWAHSTYGHPPVPIRPDHAKQVSRKYYRGNCERNSQLFNNGNYLTAIFTINLCDARHEPIRLHDPEPKDGWFARLEIERAPGTADELFAESMMTSAFLCKTFVSSQPTPTSEPIIHLQVVEPGQRWEAYYPLGSPVGTGRLEGLIYLFVGQTMPDGMARGEPHNAIKFELVVTDGKLADESDLWMASFQPGAIADPVPPGRIPYTEWWDYRPIPAITGQNSKDPKLLGIEEYVKKGLIKAPDLSEPKHPPSAQTQVPPDTDQGNK